MASNVAASSLSESLIDARDTTALTFLSGAINNDTSFFSLTRPMAAAVDTRSLFAHPRYGGHQPFVHFGDVQDDQRGEHVESEEWPALVRSLLSSHAATAGRDPFTWFEPPGSARQQPGQAPDVERAQPAQYVRRQECSTAMWPLLSSRAARAVLEAPSWFEPPESAGQQPGQAPDVERAQPAQYVRWREWSTAMWPLFLLRAARAVPGVFSWFGQSGSTDQQPGQALDVEHAQPNPLVVFLGPRSPAPLVARNQELLETLDRLSKSGDYYVYPGGQIPNDEAFNDARRFVESLPRLRLVPKVVLIVDGEVNFSWETDRIHIDLGFHGDGEGGSYFARDESGTKYYCDSFDPDELPDEVLRLII